MNDMTYAPLGGTGLTVSRLGFGASGMGNMYTQVDQEEINRTVAEAIEEDGINYFDVAPSYGPEGLAETRLGIALQGRRDKVILATKAGRYDHGTHEKPVYEFDYTPRRTRLELENSLRRLRTDYVDLYQLHDVTNSGDLDRLVSDTLPELEKLRQEGKLRKIGVTGAYLPALEYLASRSPCVDCALTFGRYNLMDVTLEEHAPVFRSIRNLGVVNSSVLFMGFLTQDHRELKTFGRHYTLEKLTAAIEQAKTVCMRYGTDLGETAMRFGLGCEHCADSTLVAMARTARLRQNMELFRTRKETDPELLKALRGILDGLYPWAPSTEITSKCERENENRRT